MQLIMNKVHVDFKTPRKSDQIDIAYFLNNH